MKFNKKQLLLLLGLLSLGTTYAQQDPHYTQYMFNQSVFNPAYAGSKESLSLGVLHREQWAGLDGAPTTSTAFAHTRVGKNVGVGLSFVSDQIGPTKENNVYADVSYTVKLAPGHKLAFGVKGGMSMQNTSYLSMVDPYVPDANDPAFQENTSNSFFNFGAGAFYYTDNYYVGLSMPNFIKNTYLDKSDRSFGSDAMHVFLTGGYVFQMNPDWKLKPSTMIKYAQGAPIGFDVNLNANLKDKLEFGVMYRIDDSFGGMINYAVLPNLKVGYAYDYVTSGLNYSTKGSHEVFVLFDIYFKKKVSSSPRYF